MKNNTTDNLVKAINKLIALDAKYRAIHNLKETARDWDMAIDIAKQALTAYEQAQSTKRLEAEQIIKQSKEFDMPIEEFDKMYGSQFIELNEREQTEGKTKEEIKGIPIQEEPKEYYEATRVHEHCYFCNTPTNTWHIKSNQPVCKDCAMIHNISEINHCVAGCKAFTGGEIKHHKDCVFYPESLSKVYDEKDKLIEGNR